MMLLEVDPNLVRPGWTPLVVIVLLGVVPTVASLFGSVTP